MASLSKSTDSSATTTTPSQASKSSQTTPSEPDDLSYLKQCLALARDAPTTSTNFRVGAMLVSFPPDSSPQILSTGYTMELPGNTHAEQNALTKFATENDVSEADLNSVMPPEMNITLYSTLEPCSERLSGITPCVKRIIATRGGGDDSSEENGGGVRRVLWGSDEPGTFVQDNKSKQLLTDAGVEWEIVKGLQDDILSVAKAGHNKDTANRDTSSILTGRLEHGISTNPKKRMMEVPPSSPPPGSM